MVEDKRVQAEEVDSLIQMFGDFATFASKSALMRSFDIHSGHPDQIFMELEVNVKFPLLWKVFKILLLLSHGQASVERGFSINKNLSVYNLQQESLVSLRLFIIIIITHGC